MSDSPYPLCGHIKDNGEPCGSPALKGEKLCHFHARAADTKLPGKPGYRLAMIECAESIQLTVLHVNQALLDGALDAKTANTIFRGLSLVKNVLSHLPNRSGKRPSAPSYRHTILSPADIASPARSAPPRDPASAAPAAATPSKPVILHPPLSPAELADLRKIIRQGPKHPNFLRASRILDAHIASRSSA
jgi:hypothetical protein